MESKESPSSTSSNPDSSIIILDLGSGYIKGGFSGSDYPITIFPTLLIDNHSQPQSADNLDIHNEMNEYTIGYKALQHIQNTLHNKSSLSVIRPIYNNEIHDWNALKAILDYCFKSELHRNPKDHSILLSVQSHLSKSILLSLSKLLFQSFQIPSLLLVNSAVLSLFSTGRTSGIVLEIGESCTVITPIFEGFPIKHAILTSLSGGADITKSLVNLLALRGVHFNTNQIDLVRDIKEKLCKVRPKPLPNNIVLKYYLVIIVII
jgi:actin